MALLSKGMWVVVADGEKAMILENAGSTAAPRLVVLDKFEQELEANRDMGTDRPGRMPDPGQSQLSAMEPTDYQRLAKERFIGQLADRVNALAAREKGRRIVLAAPPQSLAVLRDGLSKPALEAVIAELPKTLTQHPLDKIGKLVAQDIDKI
ncbi:host attachment family protein [Alkalilacustris brevis]|uniref:host attachment family protein n=1 Tax=Alkalilacustris brevis TaxID=2026338 RepID=UPI00138FCCD2|nr:host attachment family protein [Alkalilacustris brevis]